MAHTRSDRLYREWYSWPWLDGKTPLRTWRSHLLYTSLLFLLFYLTGCTFLGHGTSSQTSHLQVQQAARGQLTYVAIGASDTFGMGTDDPSTESWPVDLSSKLGDHVHLINLGIPGIVTHDALNIELPVALDAHPDVITIWLAVNDLAANVPVSSYSHDLDQLLSRLQAASPHARIAVANVPDITLLPHFQSYDLQELRTQITLYNAAIANIVNHHHVLLVDLYQQSSRQVYSAYISNDGLHPNAIGYTIIASIFYQTLQRQP